MRCIEPTAITQGEQIEWKRSFCGFPATLWTLQYRFRGVGPGADVDAVADGDSFTATLTAAQSIAMLPGKYDWQAWATETADTNNKERVASGTVTVERGFVSGETGNIDLRTDAKKNLDAIDAALLASGTSDVVMYEITTPAGSRRVQRYTRTEMLSMRKYWAGIVSRENLAERVKNGGPFAKSVNVRFFER